MGRLSGRDNVQVAEDLDKEFLMMWGVYQSWEMGYEDPDYFLKKLGWTLKKKNLTICNKGP